MAKYERRFQGDYNAFLGWLSNEIPRGSVSAKYEDGSDISAGTTRIALRVFERYSWIGSNRVSLSILVVGQDRDIWVSAVTSGGSQAVFFKINTIGENAFLDTFRNSVEAYIASPR